MRFALLGDHVDGLAMIQALVATGRHSLSSYAGGDGGLQSLQASGLAVQPVADVEEIFADPAIDAIVVASSPSDRPGHLRRALQSERPVLCMHPCDGTPDLGYEAGMMQQDTKRLLFPLLVESLHPAIGRLGEVLADPANGNLRILDWERAASGEMYAAIDADRGRFGLPGWDALRRLGGDVAEVSAFAEEEQIAADKPLLLTGRFLRGGLFRVRMLPNQANMPERLSLVMSNGRAEWSLPQGLAGPSRLIWRGPEGSRDENWPAYDPWPALVERFEAALAGGGEVHPTWQDAVRCLELDDAARRSLAKRRSSDLEYQEANEEVGFKGTMTLLGCGLLWGIVFLLVLSRWVPIVGYLIVPVLMVFIGMQFLRWVIPPKDQA